MQREVGEAASPWHRDFVGLLSHKGPSSLHGHEQRSFAQRATNKSMVFVENHRLIVDGVSDHTPSSSCFGCNETAAQRVDQEISAQSALLVADIDCQSAEE
jgi:hypothetical protein